MPNPVLERFPQLRRVTNTPTARRGIAIARQCHLVTRPLRFVVSELRGGIRAHQLATDPRRTIVLRHRTRDMEIFDEIIRPPSEYDPPAAAGAVLQSLAERRPLRVLDIGANIGLFAALVFSRYADAQVTSYEPEPENLRVLTRCAELNADADWTVLQACAMTSDCPVRITPGGFADSYVSDSGVDVAGVDVLPLLGGYDFVKMDIEGSEWPILLDKRWADAMRDVAVFTLEWHARGGPDDPRAAAISAVEAAGFVCAPSPPGWHHGTMWGWRS